MVVDRQFIKFVVEHLVGANHAIDKLVDHAEVVLGYPNYVEAKEALSDGDYLMFATMAIHYSIIDFFDRSIGPDGEKLFQKGRFDEELDILAQRMADYMNKHAIA